MNIIKNIIRRFPVKIYKKQAVIFLFVFFLLAGMQENAYCKKVHKSQKKKSAEITASAVYAFDYSNKKVIFSRNPHLKLYPASTVKLLTALVVLDNKDLKDEVYITKNAICVSPTKADLTRGAHYSVEDLLKVLLATSANDAGVALAEAVAGSEGKFALLMNKKAKKLGARNSNFSNATGLPNKKQVTTVYDLSLITRHAFNQPFIASVMKQKNIVITGSDGRAISRPNHNKLLWKIEEPCVLGKTGYTKSAGHCYAGIAYYDNKNVSVVIMKSRKPWDDIYAILGLRRKSKG